MVRKVSGPRLTLIENSVSKILEEGHVKNTRTPRRVCMKKLLTVDEAKQVETVAFSAPFFLTTPLGVKREAKLN